MNEIDDIAEMMGDDPKSILESVNKPIKSKKPFRPADTKRFGAYARALTKSTAMGMAMIEMMQAASTKTDNYVITLNEQIEKTGLIDDAEELNKLLAEMEAKWRLVFNDVNDIEPILG